MANSGKSCVRHCTFAISVPLRSFPGSPSRPAHFKIYGQKLLAFMQLLPLPFTLSLSNINVYIPQGIYPTDRTSGLRYSGSRNDRPLFEKTGQGSFVYTLIDVT